MNSTSDLEIQKQINDCYVKILKRPVDPGGLHTYFSLIKNGKLTIEELSILLEKNKFKKDKGKLSKILSSPFRILPDFLIIGEHKCGTTSLFELMMEHPNIVRPQIKEINYFNKINRKIPPFQIEDNFKKGVLWYKSHFPTIFQKYSFSKKYKSKLITGEATTHYLFQSDIVPKRVARVLPTVKLIVILRNPVDRAYSHYCMLKIEGIEPLSFEDAIGIENKELSTKINKITLPKNHIRIKEHLYLSRGVYVDNLKRWMNIFPKEQFLILQTEEFNSKPNDILNRVYTFLDLPLWNNKDHKKHNVGQYEKMNPNTRKLLVDYFKPHNKRLKEFLGTNFNWN